MTSRILTVASQKGGVGKTTVALNLAYALAERGARVLLVDTDPQGSLAASIAGAPETPGAIGWLGGDVPLAEAALSTRLDGLRALPYGDPAGEIPYDPGTALRAALERDTTWAFDLVVVDTPSGLRGATIDLLAASDHLLVPLQAEPLALRTLVGVLDALGRLNDEGAAPDLLGFLLTMLDTRTDASLRVAQETWRALPSDRVLETTIPRDVALLEASAAGVPVALLSRRRPPAAAVFDRLAAELEPALGLTPGPQDEPIPLLV